METEIDIEISREKIQSNPPALSNYIYSPNSPPRSVNPLNPLKHSLTHSLTPTTTTDALPKTRPSPTRLPPPSPLRRPHIPRWLPTGTPTPRLPRLHRGERPRNGTLPLPSTPPPSLTPPPTERRLRQPTAAEKPAQRPVRRLVGQTRPSQFRRTGTIHPLLYSTTLNRYSSMKTTTSSVASPQKSILGLLPRRASSWLGRSLSQCLVSVESCITSTRTSQRCRGDSHTTDWSRRWVVLVRCLRFQTGRSRGGVCLDSTTCICGVGFRCRYIYYQQANKHTVQGRKRVFTYPLESRSSLTSSTRLQLFPHRCFI